jgi:hypothetical protein
MSKSRERDDEADQVSRPLPVRRGVDSLLIGLTLLSVVAYLPVLRLLPRVVHSSNGFVFFSLAPMVWLALAIGAAVVWWARKGTTRRGRLVWGLFVTFSLLGAPVACTCAGMAVNRHNLIPR